jgi:hypothetical protein
MAESCFNPQYLVLHFLRGELTSTKVSRSWRGAQMSKRNHEAPFQAKDAAFREKYDAKTKILPIAAILAMDGLERPDTELSDADMEILRRMGIR